LDFGNRTPPGRHSSKSHTRTQLKKSHFQGIKKAKKSVKQLLLTDTTNPEPHGTGTAGFTPHIVTFAASVTNPLFCGFGGITDIVVELHNIEEAQNCNKKVSICEMYGCTKIGIVSHRLTLLWLSGWSIVEFSLQRQSSVLRRIKTPMLSQVESIPGSCLMTNKGENQNLCFLYLSHV
jgi:hypothetical protein